MFVRVGTFFSSYVCVCVKFAGKEKVNIVRSPGKWDSCVFTEIKKKQKIIQHTKNKKQQNKTKQNKKKSWQVLKLNEWKYLLKARNEKNEI